MLVSGGLLFLFLISYFHLLDEFLMKNYVKRIHEPVIWVVDAVGHSVTLCVGDHLEFCVV